MKPNLIFYGFTIPSIENQVYNIQMSIYLNDLKVFINLKAKNQGLPLEMKRVFLWKRNPPGMKRSKVVKMLGN